MELAIYDNFQRFQDNYIKDFGQFDEVSLADYLTYLEYQYSEIINLQNQIKKITLKEFDEIKNDYEDKRILNYFVKHTFGPSEKNADEIEIKFQNDEVKLLNFQTKRQMRYIEISKAHSEILNFVKLELLKLNYEKPQNTEIEIQLSANQTQKINSKITNIQAIGYLFTELIQKNLIEPKRKNGKISPLNVARMILEHFHFQNLDEQPTEEDLRKALFDDNRLSQDKQNLFNLPSEKQINLK